MHQPLFVQNAMDTNSDNHRANCLAWWLASTKTQQGINDFLASQRSATQADLRRRLTRCKAFLWLVNHTEDAIHRALATLPKHEQEPLAAALNEQQYQLQHHQEGMTYE